MAHVKYTSFCWSRDNIIPCHVAGIDRAQNNSPLEALGKNKSLTTNKKTTRTVVKVFQSLQCPDLAGGCNAGATRRETGRHWSEMDFFLASAAFRDMGSCVLRFFGPKMLSCFVLLPDTGRVLFLRYPCIVFFSRETKRTPPFRGGPTSTKTPATKQEPQTTQTQTVQPHVPNSQSRRVPSTARHRGSGRPDTNHPLWFNC